MSEQYPREWPERSSENVRYLRTKRDKLGHRLHHQGVRLDREEA
ncbi:MAG TPA: hypothetical protein VIW19_12125 [Gaiellaceae bacterium]